MKPRRLSLSLYKELLLIIYGLIKETVRIPQSKVSSTNGFFSRVPYIDGVDFNSFIPKNLPHKTANKLVDYYLKKLSSHQLFMIKLNSK